MPGEYNHPRIERYVRSAPPATTEGILVDLGSFPALIPGEGLVRGVVLEIDPEGLTITDRIEVITRIPGLRFTNERQSPPRLTAGSPPWS